MSTPKKSFWSTIPGVATGLVGLLTTFVGLGTLLVSLGVIGDKSSSTVTTVAPSGSSGATSGAGGSTAKIAPKGSFDVDKQTLTLTLLKPEGVVAVKNTGDTSLSMDSPKITGQGKNRFDIDADACTAITLAPKKSCEIKVTLSGAGVADATMVVISQDAVGSSSVSLKATL